MKILFYLFLCQTVFAQSQYVPVKPTDKSSKANSYRHAKEIFKIHILTNKIESYGLEQNEKDYKFYHEASGQKKYFKLSNEAAEELDQSFVSQFISLKYSFPKSDNKCKTIYKLFMRGESEFVCKLEEKRTQLVQNVLKKIHSSIN